MKNLQKGFGALQVVVVLACVVAIATVAVPKYQAFVIKSKMTEAFSIAGDAKAKLAEFYMSKSRFPRTESEAASITTETVTPPKYVRELVINHEDEDNEIVIEVYFKDGAISEEVGADDFVYIAGNRSSVPGALLEWNCGANGIDASYLLDQCGE